MKIYKTWKNAFETQQKAIDEYDNGLYGWSVESGVANIDNIPFALKGVEIVWLIMENDFCLDDYQESATEIGIKKDGTWVALYDGHCSCYGWEADESNVTYYENLKLLLKADEKARIILDYKTELNRHFPFLKRHLRLKKA